MRRRAASALGVAVLAAGVVLGLPSARAAGTAPAGDGSVLAGRWRLDSERSDDARQKMREAVERRRGGADRGGPGGGFAGRGGRGGGPGARSGMGGGDPREALRPLFEAPVELAITPTESEIVILEKDGRMRTLHPDGRKYKAEGGAVEVQSGWDGGKLVVETKTEAGSRITETFEVAPDRSRLTVTLKLDGSRGPAVTVKRVYDAAETSPGP